MFDFLLIVPWWAYCAFAMAGTAAYGIFMRFADPDIHPSLFGIAFNGIASLILFVFVLAYAASGATLEWTWIGVALGVTLGLGFVGVDRGVIAMYRRGAPVSLGMPIVRISVALTTALIGFVFFAEALTLTKIAGILIGCTGIYLALQKK